MYSTSSTSTRAPARSVLHAIVIARTRLRVEREDVTGTLHYFVDDRETSVNSYLAVTQRFIDDGVRRLKGSTCHD